MTQTEFLPKGPVTRATFSVGDDSTLTVTLDLANGQRQLVLHDFIQNGKSRHNLFHAKTQFFSREDALDVQTTAIDKETGAPIPGLMVLYRFTFCRDKAAFYLSAGFAGDACFSGLAARLLDVSWKGLNPTSFTGYEYDAAGAPFSRTFPIPEPNPQAADYEARQKLTRHTLFEVTKTRPQGFSEAVALHGKDGYLAVYGGTPVYHVEAEYISVFPDLATYNSDLRFFSGSNSMGAWFVLEQPENLFDLMAELDSQVPSMQEYVMLPFPEQEIPLAAGSLKLLLLRAKGGVWTKAASTDVPCQPCPLFRLELWDTVLNRPVETDSGSGWDKVDLLHRQTYLRIALSDPENGKISGISVICEAFLQPEQHRIRWQMQIVNRSDRFSVCKATYPQCVAQGYDTGYATIACGAVFPQFNKHARVFSVPYPRGVRTAMPFMAVYNPGAAMGGLYVGVHDPDGCPKELCMAGAAQSQCTLLSAMCQAPWSRKAGNSFTMPGAMIWQGFDGDWFDAVNIYRDFVHTQAAWFPPLRGRPDTPQWIREMPVWMMHFIPNVNPDADPVPTTLREKYPDKHPEDWYRAAIRFRQEIGVPTAYNLWNWHWAPFNNDNPNYFPAHHDLKEGMRELRKADIRVVPYIVGYSWDMNDRRGDSYRFLQEALPATAKNMEGKPLFRSCASKEPDGSLVKFARMCPTTAFWKNELRQIVRRLYTDYGMDGVYLDVVSAKYEPCCDPDHLHEPGFGSYWWKAYCQLIAGLRTDAPEDFAVVSESVSEVYAGALDGYLTWTWVFPNSVPAFPRVYGGRVVTYGRIITWNNRDDADHFRFHVAQSLAYGQQLGWVHPEIVDDPLQFPFLKKMAQLRWLLREFFATAEMLRPPVVEGQMELMDSQPYLRGKFWSHEKSVVAAGWEDADGTRNLFVINSGNTEAHVSVTLRQTEYNLPESAALFAQDGFLLLGRDTEGELCRLHCCIAPQGFGVLQWTEQA